MFISFYYFFSLGCKSTYSHKCCGEYLIEKDEFFCSNQTCSGKCYFVYLGTNNYYESFCLSSFTYSYCHTSFFTIFFIFSLPNIIISSIILFIKLKSFSPLKRFLLNLWWNIMWVSTYKMIKCYKSQDHVYYYLYFVFLYITPFYYINLFLLMENFFFFTDLVNVKYMDTEDLIKIIYNYLIHKPEIFFHYTAYHQTNFDFSDKIISWVNVTT